VVISMSSSSVSSSGRSGPVDVDEMEVVRRRVFIVGGPQAEGSVRLRSSTVTIMDQAMIVEEED
jgi:hypothetical protein